MADTSFFESAHSNKNVDEFKEEIENDGQNLNGNHQKRHADDSGDGEEKAAGEPAEQERN